MRLIFLLFLFVSCAPKAIEEIFNESQQQDKKLKEKNLEYNCEEGFEPSLDPSAIDYSEQSNLTLAKGWMKNCYYKNNPHDEPVLPNTCTSFSKNIFVSTNGNDSNNGSKSSPYKTIQYAINQSNPEQCTLITVEAGDYYESLNITVWADGSGTRTFNKLTIFSNDRDNTRLISKQTISGWEKIPITECPQFDPNKQLNTPCEIYRKRFNNEHIAPNYHIHYKDKVIVPMQTVGSYSFREIVQAQDLVNEADLQKFQTGEKLVSNEQTELTELGKQKYKNHLFSILETDLSALQFMGSAVLNSNDLTWNGIGSTYFVQRHTNNDGSIYSYLYFKAFDQDLNPTPHISTHLGYNVYIVGQSNIVLQNLTLQNGRYGVVMSRNSHDIKIIGNKISNNFRSVYLYGEKNGIVQSPHDIEVSGNEITNNLNLILSPQFKGAYRNFIIIKQTLGDTHGVNMLNIGDNINIHHNLIYNVGNGIQSYSTNNTDFSYRDLKVHHNFIVNTIDDALEPGGDCQNCHWYSNHLRNTSQGLRLKINNNNSTGPVFIYKNVFYNQDRYNHLDDIHYSNQTTFYFHTPSEVPIYIYNNLFLGFRCLIPPTSSAWLYNPDNTVLTDEFNNIQSMQFKLHFINNILSCRFSMPNISYGTWPMHWYTEETREFDVNGDEVAKVSQKNRQPLLSHNWVGGIKDHRTIVNNKAMYENDYMFILAKDSNLNDLNYIYKSPISNTPKHIFSNFNEDESGFLHRTNFCVNTNLYPEIENGGLNINDTSKMRWSYVHNLTHGNREYFHLIDRTIDIALPGIDFNNGKLHVGPFDSTSENCNNFGWLLEND